MSEGIVNHTVRVEEEEKSTFESIFFRDDVAVSVRVPDYQRAYSWEQKQSELFLGDLEKYQGGNKGYYFGHFIAEAHEDYWEIVDGQQRITTFVLFLMVCRVLAPEDAHRAYSLIPRYVPVSYDQHALRAMNENLSSFLKNIGHYDEKNPPTDDQIQAGMGLHGVYTRSQRRMALALLRFHRAFQSGGTLDPAKIGQYIDVIMGAHCSRHLTRDKAVAVNIFELQNTRGVPLTTLEKVKAKLMKFVYDHGGSERKQKTERIQAEFGKIYGMEERLAADSFRGEMTMDQLLRLHLRVVDDGNKKSAKDFSSPPANANAEALVDYVENRLWFIDGDKIKSERPREMGVKYALDFAREFKKSVRIASVTLPEWDRQDQDSELVGDVLILDSDISYQFFLIICRLLENEKDKADGRIGNIALQLWEKLLFTRDFHGGYYNLKGDRDNFPALFAACGPDENHIVKVISGYLTDGFRPDRTKGLQLIVGNYLNKYRDSILNQAFYWWKSKMIYAIYKYEIRKEAKIRKVMKGKISVEHILPQDWEWKWIDPDNVLTSEKKTEWANTINSFINGVGNLLLLTPGENSAESNKHPADKEYVAYKGGSYGEHNQDRERWKNPDQWSVLIKQRGEKIFEFMLKELVGAPEDVQSSLTP